jgi:periplasmic protein TonB
VVGGVPGGVAGSAGADVPPPPPPPAPTPKPTVEATPVPKQINVSGGVLQGSAIRKVQPPYPPIAKAARAAGAVQVQVTIGEDGRVIDAAVVSGHPLLRDAALQAARQWQFKPTELSGTPVKVQGVLTFNFTLQ